MASRTQTSQYHSYPSKPETTKELVSRFINPATQEKEKIALQALIKTMIENFEDDRRLSFVSEASELASVAGDQYLRLLLTFQNAIIAGTIDNTSLPRELLIKFSVVLQCAGGKEKENIRNQLQLGPMADSLHKRLKAAVIQAEHQTAYELVQALSSVLDTMNFIKTSGLGREEFHAPLLRLLYTLRKHEEPRLAQAADYAHQALFGIPNDESPLTMFWRYFKTIGTPIATFASAASTMDPAKFLIALETLEDLKEVVDSMVEAVKALSDARSDIRGGLKDGSFLQKQRNWYLALRYTDMLIHADAFIDLGNFVKKVPCRQQKEFLCGLCAQLEQAWIVGAEPTKRKIVDFLQENLIPNRSTSDDECIQQWVEIVADTMKRPDWKKGIEHPHEHWLHRLRKKKKYVPKISVSESPNEAPIAKLLEKAWEECNEAKVFYADVRVLQHYTTQSRLAIERVSGRLLPMDRCYINLAILKQAENVDRSTEHSSPEQASQFTLAARLRIQEPEKDIQVTLPDLFNPRKWDDGRLERPKRILIHGRAGVGKTTLCKKIVHEFIYNGMWDKIFDRILWVPLRNLKRRFGTGYNLEKLFEHEFFASKLEDIGLAKALWSKVGTDGDRTLFILDGLDEVYKELDKENDMSRFLNDLLAQPDVIITARPHANLSQGLDSTSTSNRFLKLETVGFFPEQVSAYIKSVFTDTHISDKVQTFLEGRLLIQGLIRIPILLDILCYTWDQNSRVEPPSTMTELYENIELKLWQKDLYLEGGRSKTEMQTTYRLALEQDNLAGRYIHALEALAFSGLNSNTQEFTRAQRDRIYREFALAISGRKFEQLSFLRTSNIPSEGTEEDEGDYHFLHLTFQEYFAARYLVRRWIAGEDLVCLDLKKSKVKAKTITAVHFIEMEKYNPGYDILWRFVTGLLLSGRHEEKLCQFFQIIEAEPRDLLGSVHQRLVMHCLSELVNEDLPSFAKMRSELENRLREWVLSECESRGSSQLVREMEFPQHILQEILNSESEDTKAAALRSLNPRLNLPAQIKNLAALWIRDGGSANLKAAALAIFRPPNEAPSEVLTAAADHLHHQDSFVRLAAVQVLLLASNIDLMDFWDLEDGLNSPELQRSLFEVLGRQVRLSREIFQKFAEKLNCSDRSRRTVLKVLAGSSSVPGEIIQTLAEHPRSDDAPLATAAADALCGQSDLPDTVLQALAKLLQDFGPDFKISAIRTFAAQPALSELEDFLLKLAELLRDPDGNVRLASAKVLEKQQILPEKVLKEMESQLEHTDLRDKQGVLRALGGRSPLTESMLHCLEQLAKSAEPEAMSIAVQALAQRSALSDELFQHLVDLSTCSKSSHKSTAVKVLGEHWLLSDKALDVLEKALEDANQIVRRTAINTLKRRSDLPQTILKALKKQLNDPELRTAAAKVLGEQLSLSPDIVPALAKHFQDTELNNTESVHPEQLFIVTLVEALGRNPYLPDEVVEDLAKRVLDKDLYIRKTVVNALGRQATLSRRLLTTLAEMLVEADFRLRSVVAGALDQHLLRHHEDVFSVLLDSDGRCLEWYFYFQRGKSFFKHQCWYIKDGTLYIDMPPGSVRISVDVSAQERLRELSKLPISPHPHW